MNLIELKKYGNHQVQQIIVSESQLEAIWTIEFKPKICVFNDEQKQQNVRTSLKKHETFIVGYISKLVVLNWKMAESI